MIIFISSQVVARCYLDSLKSARYFATSPTERFHSMTLNQRRTEEGLGG